MPDQRILITGGAGFIGSHVADELLKSGYQVRVYDSLHPQVHGDTNEPPAYLSPHVEFVHGDVREVSRLGNALRNVDAVIHLDAAVGVGQSMYQIARYTSVNDLGTAVLLEAMANCEIRKLVVASSMSVYGEGLYQDPESGKATMVPERSREQLERGDWEVETLTGVQLSALPTPESKVPLASSIYALSKFVQERQCLIWGDAYKVPTAALRFFNVYGPRQALSNPYTGVLAIFASRLLNSQRPIVFEDGLQRRDFVNVHDVARAVLLALESPEANGQAINIGSGQPISILEIAKQMSETLGHPELAADVVGKFRVGDVRHCFADISKATALMGYRPKVDFAEGLYELAEWLIDQEANNTGVGQAAKDELVRRVLVV